MLLNNFSSSSFSVAFLFVGMPLVYLMREYLPLSKVVFTYSITALLLSLVFNYKNLISLKFYIDKPLLFIFILLFNFFIFIANAFLSSGALVNQEFFFIIISFLFFLAICTNQNKEFHNLYIYILLISSITTYASLLFDTGEWMERGRFYVGDTTNPNLSSFISLINILSIIYLFTIKKELNLLIKSFLLFTAALSFYIYTLSFSKSAIIGFVFCLLFIMFIKSIFRSFFKLKVLLYIAVGVSFLFVVIPELSSVIVQKLSILISAKDSYLTGNDGSMSATIRHENLNNAFLQLSGISFFQGEGIFTTRADLPLLQVFTDLGYMAGTINLLAMLFIPLVILLNVAYILGRNNTQELYDTYFIVAVLFIFYLFNNFFHGTPYEHSVWYPILLLYKLSPWMYSSNE